MSDDQDGKQSVFTRWPLLLSGLTLTAIGTGLNIYQQVPIGYGLWALAAASFGAFMYAEGARHREWWDKHNEKKEDQP